MRAISFMFFSLPGKYFIFSPEARKEDMLSLFLETDLDGQPCIEKK